MGHTKETTAEWFKINDPDPELWIIIYLFPALIAFAIALKPNLTELPLVKLVNSVLIFMCCTFGAYILITKYDFKRSLSLWVIHEETGREFAGLLIVALWTALMHVPPRILTKATLVVAGVVIAFPIGLWTYIYFNKSYRSSWPEHCQSTLYSDV